MKKLWLVFLNEYKRHVLRKRFIFAILSMPFFVVITILIGFLTVWLQYNLAPAGYVDGAEILVYPDQLQPRKFSIFKPVQFVAYLDEASARAALDQGEVQAYFLIPPAYMDTGEVTLVSGAKTGENVTSDFGKFIVTNMLRDQPEELKNRFNTGNNMIIRSLDGTREMDEDNWMTVVTPILAGVLFIVVVNISGNYLLQAVVEEKENRTMEILVTSISPTQLMGGKVLGNLAVGLTQLVAWFLFAMLALLLAPIFIPGVQAPKIAAGDILLMLGTLLPAFVMVAAAMGAIGATATEAREAQQISGWFTIPLVIPLWFISAIMFKPNGALAVGMSLFPLTAPIALPMRAAFTQVPAWQIILVISSLCLLAAFALWLSGRIFRLGMLRYGKRVRLAEAFRKAR